MIKLFFTSTRKDMALKFLKEFLGQLLWLASDTTPPRLSQGNGETSKGGVTTLSVLYQDFMDSGRVKVAMSRKLTELRTKNALLLSKSQACEGETCLTLLLIPISLTDSLTQPFISRKWNWQAATTLQLWISKPLERVTSVGNSTSLFVKYKAQ